MPTQHTSNMSLAAPYFGVALTAAGSRTTGHALITRCDSAQSGGRAIQTAPSDSIHREFSRPTAP